MNTEQIAGLKVQLGAALAANDDVTAFALTRQLAATGTTLPRNIVKRVTQAGKTVCMEQLTQLLLPGRDNSMERLSVDTALGCKVVEPIVWLKKLKTSPDEMRAAGLNPLLLGMYSFPGSPAFGLLQTSCIQLGNFAHQMQNGVCLEWALKPGNALLAMPVKPASAKPSAQAVVALA